MEKRNISVCFSSELFHKYEEKDSIIVIVDVLRATSVINTAFHFGIKEIIPVLTLEEALQYKGRKGYIIAGERNAIERMEQYLSQKDKVASFDNSKTNPASLVPSTTALSPYLSNGSLSVRLFYHRIQETLRSVVDPVTTPSVSLQRQLYWRELAHVIGY